MARSRMPLPPPEGKPKGSSQKSSRVKKSPLPEPKSSRRPIPAPSSRVNEDWDRRTENKPPRGGWLGGCGLFVVVIALLSIIALVGFLVAGLTQKEPSGPARIQVPDNVPPAAARPAPDIDIHGMGRTSLQLSDWAAPISEKTGIPVQALIAYGNAEVIARQSRPACGVTWNTLAGLAYVETVHGTYDGVKYGVSKLDQNGFAVPPIFGPQLSGGQFAQVADTDNGALDGDSEFDRAMGPMQFIPESWKRFGVDANGDGHNDPQNIDDAAASAVRLLCDEGRNLGSPEGWTQAIRAYNLSDEYVINVRDAAANYAVNQAPVGKG